MSNDTRYLFRRRGIALVLTAVFALGVILLLAALWRRARIDNFSEVVPARIYRSGQPRTAQWDKLYNQFALRTVLSLRETNDLPEVMSIEKSTCERLGIRFVNVPMPGDGLGDFEAYDQALAVLSDPNAAPVLVHCARGVYRTGGVIAAYRMLVQNWPETAAHAEIRAHRFKSSADHPLFSHLNAYFESRKNRFLPVDNQPEKR